MSGDPLRDYWDSCVFLNYINANAEHIDTIDAVLAESQELEVEILTSTISVVEVSFGEIERTNRALDEATQTAIDDLWSTGSPFQLVEFFPALANRARDLVQRAMVSNRSLQAADAIHLATAEFLEVDRILTYDERFLSTGDALGFNITRPVVRVPTLFTGEHA